MSLTGSSVHGSQVKNRVSWIVTSHSKSFSSVIYRNSCFDKNNWKVYETSKSLRQSRSLEPILSCPSLKILPLALLQLNAQENLETLH